MYELDLQVVRDAKAPYRNLVSLMFDCYNAELSHLEAINPTKFAVICELDSEDILDAVCTFSNCITKYTDGAIPQYELDILTEIKSVFLLLAHLRSELDTYGSGQVRVKEKAEVSMVFRHTNTFMLELTSDVPLGTVARPAHSYIMLVHKCNVTQIHFQRHPHFAMRTLHGDYVTYVQVPACFTLLMISMYNTLSNAFVPMYEIVGTRLVDRYNRKVSYMALECHKAEKSAGHHFHPDREYVALLHKEMISSEKS